MTLTDTAIRAAKPKDKPYKLSDSAGLYLMINPTGSRLWRLKYRLAGKEKVLAIGAYPAVSLAAARDKREQAKTLSAQGIDPSEAKQEAKREAVEESANTVRIISEEYLAKARRENRAPSTVAKNEWLLGLANEEIGNKPIREISAAMILDASGRQSGADGSLRQSACGPSLALCFGTRFTRPVPKSIRHPRSKRPHPLIPAHKTG